MHGSSYTFVSRGFVVTVTQQTPAPTRVSGPAASTPPEVLAAMLVAYPPCRSYLVRVLRARQPHAGWAAMTPGQLTAQVALLLMRRNLHVSLRAALADDGTATLGPAPRPLAPPRPSPKRTAARPQPVAAKEVRSPAHTYRLDIVRLAAPGPIGHVADVRWAGEHMPSFRTDGSPYDSSVATGGTWVLRGLVEAARQGTLDEWGTRAEPDEGP